MTNIKAYFQHHFLFPFVCLLVLFFVSSAEGQQTGQAVAVIVKEAKIRTLDPARHDHIE
jgi:hypothetical protein